MGLSKRLRDLLEEHLIQEIELEEEICAHARKYNHYHIVGITGRSLAQIIKDCEEEHDAKQE